jgi:hypothetical protein
MVLGALVEKTAKPDKSGINVISSKRRYVKPHIMDRRTNAVNRDFA